MPIDMTKKQVVGKCPSLHQRLVGPWAFAHSRKNGSVSLWAFAHWLPESRRSFGHLLTARKTGRAACGHLPMASPTFGELVGICSSWTKRPLFVFLVRKRLPAFNSETGKKIRDEIFAKKRSSLILPYGRSNDRVVGANPAGFKASRGFSVRV